MNVVVKNGFASIDLKLANMRDEQNFTIYPYTGGELIQIQSDKRFCQINLKTSKGLINRTNQQRGAYSIHLVMQPHHFEVPSEVIKALTDYIVNKQSGGNSVVSWETNKLFSKIEKIS